MATAKTTDHSGASSFILKPTFESCWLFEVNPFVPEWSRREDRNSTRRPAKVCD